MLKLNDRINFQINIDVFFYDDINMLNIKLMDYCVLKSEEDVIHNLPVKFNFILRKGSAHVD